MADLARMPLAEIIGCDSHLFPWPISRMPTGNLLPSLMLLAGLSLVVAILMRRLYRRTRGKSKTGQSPTKASQSYSQPLLDAPREVTRWQVEMHEVARELRAELDSKAVLVQTLIGMLREESERLEAVLGRLDSLNLPENLQGDADLLAEIHRLTEEIASDSHATAEQATRAADRLNQPADAGRVPSTAQSPLGEAHVEQICQLADQGLAAETIAQQLSLPPGEVELVLGIQGSRQRPHRGVR